MSQATLKIALCFGVSRVLTLTTPGPITDIDVYKTLTDDLLVVVEIDGSYSANLIVHPDHRITLSAEATGIVAEVAVATG